MRHATDGHSAPEIQSHRAKLEILPPIARRGLLGAALAAPLAGAFTLPAARAADEWARRHAEYLRLFAAWDSLPEEHPAYNTALEAYWDAGVALVEETPAGTETQFSQKLALVRKHFPDDLLVESGTLDRLIAEARRMERLAV